MDYTREVTNNAYGTRSSLNHQPTADFRVAQGAYSADTTPNYLTGQGGEGFLEPGYNLNPEDSPTSHGTPFLTEGESPEQGWYEDEDFTRTLTPDQAAPILWNDSCQLGSYLNTAAPIDPLSSAGHVDNHCLGYTVENEHISCHLDLSQDELNKNMKLFLESIAPEPVPSSSTNVTYPDSYTPGVDFSLSANHYISSHFTDEPATTTCLSDAPVDYSCPPFDPSPPVAQNVVAPYTQAHSSQSATTYGTNPPSSYSLAAPPMEERGWHQRTFSPTYEQQPRTLTSRRHHRYNPYPQALCAGPSTSTSVSGMGTASPVASSSRLPYANLVDDGGHFVSPNYPLSQTLGPDMEPVVQDAGADLENRPHSCHWGTCSAGPMGRKALLRHFREHAVILENGRVKECLWSGCESGGRFPMTWSGFKRHVNETQSHVGLFKQVVCETCGKSLGTRSVRKHRKSCPKLGNQVESEKGKGKKRQDRRNA